MRNLFQTGDGDTSTVVSVYLELKDTNWMRRAFLEALWLMADANNWIAQGDQPPEIGADAASLAILTVQWGVQMGSTPIGVFMPYAGALPLSSDLISQGWRACNGDIVRIDQYPELYAVIGTAFNTGGEETDEFRLPNMKERVPVGVGDFVVGGKFNQPGQSGGEVSHVLTVNELPAHSHTINRSTSSGSGGQPAQAAGSTGGSPWATNQTGDGAAHNNLQPYLVVNYIIKAA